MMISKVIFLMGFLLILLDSMYAILCILQESTFDKGFDKFIEKGIIIIVFGYILLAIGCVIMVLE